MRSWHFAPTGSPFQEESEIQIALHGVLLLYQYHFLAYFYIHSQLLLLLILELLESLKMEFLEH